MLNNPTLVKVLEDNNKLDSFNETIKGFGKNHIDLYKFLNNLNESQSQSFSNLIDSTNSPGTGEKPYLSSLKYPKEGIELELYLIYKSGVGKGEYYATFKIKGVENFESNTYDLKYDDKKIEVKQIAKSSDPSDPAKKGRLTQMKSFNRLATILTHLNQLKGNNDWENFLSDKSDLKDIIDKLYDPVNDNIDKIMSGEIAGTSTQSKNVSRKDRFLLVSNIFKLLNKYSEDKGIKQIDNYDFNALWVHPYVKNYREGLKDLLRDRESVWKNNSDGTEKDIYVLLFVDDIKKVFYGPGFKIFPGKSKSNPNAKSSNNTNVSRGGVRFFKNPELTEKQIQRLKELAGINK